MCAAQVDVRIEAARAVWTLANDRTAIPVLAAALRDGYWSGIAAEALGDIGPAAKEALPALLPLLRYNGGQTRIFAVEAISKIGGGAMELLPPLLQACSDADCRVRQAAVQAIGKIGPNACAAAPTLIRLLDDFHGTVRVAAAEALWNIEKHPAAIERIAAELSTDDRAPALVIVPSPQDASPLPDVSTMTDFPAAVHQAAVAALVRISPAAPQAIAVLRDVKRHDRRSVHIMAALALAKTIPNENPLPTLTAGLTSPKYSVRICAADALAKMGTQAKSATPALLEALRVCAAEAPALPRLKEFEFLESLRANFETNDRVSHSRAWSGILGALREIDPKAASAYESGPDFKALLNYETR
jgi:HEAT repeat protein